MSLCGCHAQCQPVGVSRIVSSYLLRFSYFVGRWLNHGEEGRLEEKGALDPLLAVTSLGCTRAVRGRGQTPGLILSRLGL